MYTGVSLTPAMTNKMVQITVEILDVLATATKEMGQSVASESNLHLMLLEANIGSEKFVKKVAGWTDLEDGLTKLEKLTTEEIAMAIAQLVKVTDSIDNKVTGVGEGVRGVDEKVEVVTREVQVVKAEVLLVNDNVQAIDNKLQAIAEGGQRLFSKSLASFPTFITQTTRQTQQK